MRRVRFLTHVAAALLLLIGVLVLLPGPVDPAAWRPPAKPALIGPLAPDNPLRPIDLLGDEVFDGPEDVELLGDWLYFGLEDGSILRMAVEDERRVERFTHTAGRPLGLDFDPAGTLWVADADRGLVSVDSEGAIAVRSNGLGDVPFGFADDVDVGPDGTVYFSDASSRFGKRQLHLEPLEGRPWGRLLAYDPPTGRTRALLADLYFANGVAVSKDGSFVLVAETFAYRIQRLWLKGPRAGEAEVFADNLPGFPDGVSVNPRGGFWVAVFSTRNDLLDEFIHPNPWLARLVARIPPALQPRAARYGMVLELDGGGAVRRSFHDPGGLDYAPITSAEEWDGVLYLGSIEPNRIGRRRLR